MQLASKFLTRMTLFLVLVIAAVGALYEPLGGAFLANPAINGVIVLVLLIGIIYAYRRVIELRREVAWINAYRGGKGKSKNGKAAPRLMAPAAQLLTASDEDRPTKLSAGSMRSVLDGIATRLDESRDVSKYLTSILIMLGLLGTFWGLLDVLPSIAGTIRGLTVDGTDTAIMFDELKAGLEAPLAGMATAFSSSLFGLAGSLTVGFLDLQAGQAQNRFYNDVEDWLAGVTRLSRADDGGGMGAFASPSSYLTALMEQTADGLDKLGRTLKRLEAERKDEAQVSRSLVEALGALSDRVHQQSGVQKETLQASDEQLSVLREIAAKEMPQAAPALDDASRDHLRNLDIGIKRLADSHTASADLMVDELRAELKILSRTLAAALDGRGRAPIAAPDLGRPERRTPPSPMPEPAAAKPAAPQVSQPVVKPRPTTETAAAPTPDPTPTVQRQEAESPRPAPSFLRATRDDEDDR